MTDRPAFVLHEHDRPRHHFDLRLEEEGVLRSWAIPKGLPQDFTQDRLAVPVDDHALGHATYEDDSKRIADSVASVPEFTMRTISQLGTRRVIVSAIVTSSGLGAPNDRPLRAVSMTAASTFGWLWPAIIGPHDPT